MEELTPIRLDKVDRKILDLLQRLVDRSLVVGRDVEVRVVEAHAHTLVRSRRERTPLTWAPEALARHADVVSGLTRRIVRPAGSAWAARAMSPGLR